MFHFWSQPFSCKCWNTELLKVLLAVVVVHWSLTQISVPVWHRNLSESSLSRTHQGGDGQGASQRSWHSPRALCQNIMANDGHHERWKWKRLGRGPNKWSLTSGLCQFLFQLVLQNFCASSFSNWCHRGGWWVPTFRGGWWETGGVEESYQVRNITTCLLCRFSSPHRCVHVQFFCPT